MNFDAPFFLCIFLPALVLLYVLIPGKLAKKWLMILASLLFCAFGSIRGTAILAASALFNYCAGTAVRKNPKCKLLLFWGISADLMLLGFYKYLSVFGISLPAGFAVPLGISFFTFKEVSYLVDCSRKGKNCASHFSDFLLYISFFPQILSGPISRFSEFPIPERCAAPEDMAKGLRRFVFGMSKRVFLAQPMCYLADSVFALESGSLSASAAWIGAISFCFYIYFDFSSYSDMAIGLSGLFGYPCPENFRHPYLADSITDFWRRWHISLSQWFRDYVYIPLGGSRRGKLRSAANKIIVFLLCGLWHGASLNYLVWGAWHGCFAAGETLQLIPRNPKSVLGRALSHAYTLLTVCIGFVLFRAADLPSALSMIGTMFFGGSGDAAGVVLLHRSLTYKNGLVLLASILCCLPIEKCFCFEKHPSLWNGLTILLLGACLIAISAGGFRPFLYAQF